MTSDLIKLALKLLKCNQKNLAIRLNVSPSQITKWKKDEHMSWDMREHIENLLNLEGFNPLVVLMAGSVNNAKKWQSLIHYLADLAQCSAETGYNTIPLIDELDILLWQTFYTLKGMGVHLPEVFPKELEINHEELDNDEYFENLHEAIDDNPFSKLIYEIYLSLNDIYGFYIAYIYETLWLDELESVESEASNIDSGLIDLAASKLEENEDYMFITNDFRKFKHKTQRDYERWLTVVKECAIQHNIPLKAEFLDLVYETSGQLGQDAERESLGFNKGKLHPDIYMNELLTGMRAIHQVLPAILKKLDIYDDFELDYERLRLK